MHDSGNWILYILRCADDSLYTGIATDIERRVREHEAGVRGAKYLRGRGPLRLVAAMPAGDRCRASRVERHIKRLPKARKEQLVRAPDQLQALLNEL